MSLTAELFFARVRRRAASLSPDLAREFLRAVEIIRTRLSTREIESLINSGRIEDVIHTALSEQKLDTAFAGFRAQLHETVRNSTSYFARDIPIGAVARSGIFFDPINSRTLEALSKLDTEVMTRLKTDVREVVREVIREGFAKGAGPRTTGVALRKSIGLGPSQLKQVENFRAALEQRDASKALTYKARDRRFDARIKSGKLTPAQIDKLVDSYTKRRISINAATTAKTATVDAMKVGQRNAWETAMENGAVPDGYELEKTWVGVMDDRERPEHVAMEGETVPFDQPYSNGQMIAGEGDWNCRCIDRVRAVRRASTRVL